tara:strand:- start:61468 stop:61614 length:147 start_codon:yes stop_codon:yes gene_type:complete
MADTHSGTVAQPLFGVLAMAPATGTGNIVFGGIRKDVQFFFYTFERHS